MRRKKFHSEKNANSPAYFSRDNGEGVNMLGTSTKLIITGLFALYIILSLTGCAIMGTNENDVVIVNDGVAEAVIVVGHKPTPEISLAAGELRKLVKEISGTELDILDTIDEVACSGKTKIYLGESFAGLFPNVDLTRCRKDGYWIKSGDDSLLIAGPTPIGTEFGIYGFLQDYLGVRWFLPGPDGTFIPKSATLTLPPIDKVDNPTFLSRSYSSPTLWGKGSSHPAANRMDQAWYRHNRMLARYHCSHNIGKIIKPSLYGERHPEYFPFRGGERRVPKTDRPVGFQPCMTNPKVISLCAEAATTYFDDNPDTMALSYSIGVNDWGGYCECDECLKANGGPPKPNSRGLPNFSNLAFQFGNRVAAELPKRHKNKLVGMLAYANIRDCPDDMKIHPNLALQRVAAFNCYFNPDDRRDMEATAKFARECENFSVYDYLYGSGYSTPQLPLGLLEEYVNFLADLNAKGWNSEIYSNWSVDGIKYYLLSRKLWNPKLRIQDLLEEFCRDMFGLAAKDMIEFYRICQERWETQKGPTTKYHLRGSIKQTKLFDVPTCEKLLSLLRSARKTCSNPHGQVLIAHKLLVMEMALANAEKVRRDFQIGVITDVDKLAQLTLESLALTDRIDDILVKIKSDAFSFPRKDIGKPLGMNFETAASILYNHCQAQKRPEVWRKFLNDVNAVSPKKAAFLKCLDKLPEFDKSPELFENADLTNGKPGARNIKDWTTSDWGSQGVKSSIKLEKGDDGIPFCELKGLAHCFMYAPNPGLEQFVKLTPNRWYLCQFETRDEGDLVVPSVKVYTAGGTESCPVTAGSKWTPVAWLFKTPGKAGKTRVRFSLGGLGEADFRKLSLKSLPEGLELPDRAGKLASAAVRPPLAPPKTPPAPVEVRFDKPLPTGAFKSSGEIMDGELIVKNGYLVFTINHRYTAAYGLKISITAAGEDGATLGAKLIAKSDKETVAKKTLWWNAKLQSAPKTFTTTHPFNHKSTKITLLVYRSSNKGTLKLRDVILTPEIQ